MKRLLPLYIVVFNGFVGYSLMIAVFTPLFINGKSSLAPDEWTLGTRSIILGVVLSLYPLGQFIGSPILGALSDRFGRKQPLIISILLCVLGYVCIAYAIQAEQLSILIPSLFITGLFEANIAIAQSAIADVASDANRGRLFGYIYGFVSAAYIIGPLVGGKLTDQALVSWFGPAIPFWATALLVAASLVYTLISFKETHSASQRVKTGIAASFMNLADVFKDRDIRTLYLANFILYLTIFGYFRCYPMYIVDEFKMNISTESEFIAWVAVPLILMNFVFNAWIFKRYSFRSVAIVSGVLMAILMVVVVIPGAQWALWITLFLATAPLAVCMTSIASLISSRVDGDRQGRVMGNNQAIQVGAEGISGLVGGLFAAMLLWLPLVTFSVIALIGVGLLFFLDRNTSGESIQDSH